MSGGSERTRDILNPATGKLLARMSLSTPDEIGPAVASAAEAFEQGRRTAPVSRARCFFRLKDLIEQSFQWLSCIQTAEHGKTIDESRGETRRGAGMVEVAAGIPSFMMGYNVEDIAANIEEYVVYQPLGVFCCIAPFNFPFMVPLSGSCPSPWLPATPSSSSHHPATPSAR